MNMKQYCELYRHSIFVRIERNGKWMSVPMSDLNEEEFDKMVAKFEANGPEWIPARMLEPGEQI